MRSPLQFISKLFQRPSQTRTSALRERSRSGQSYTQATSSELKRNSSSGSSSSFASGRSAPKPGSLAQNVVRTETKSALSTSPATQQKQLESDLEGQPCSTLMPDIQESTPKSNNKKEVTSRIASLWKKVEDSKKKGSKEKDNKVWISKGKVIPENERALIKPGTQTF